MDLVSFTLSLIFCLLIGIAAHADEMFYDTCATGSGSLSNNSFGDATRADFVLVSATSTGVLGLSCQDIKSLHNGAEMIQITLTPALFLLKQPGIKAELATQLTELGLELTNPAVLGITVIGITGVSVVTLVLKVSLEQCQAMDREQLRQSILESVDAKLGLKGDPPLVVQE